MSELKEVRKESVRQWEGRGWGWSVQLRIECQNLNRCGGSPCEGQLEAKYQSPAPHTAANADWLCMLDPTNKYVKNNRSQFSLCQRR